MVHYYECCGDKSVIYVEEKFSSGTAILFCFFFMPFFKKKNVSNESRDRLKNLLKKRKDTIKKSPQIPFFMFFSRFYIDDDEVLINTALCISL